MPVHNPTSVSDTYDSLLSTTLREYRPKLYDQIFRTTPLLWKLEQSGRKRVQNGGYEIAAPMLYEENSTFMAWSGYDLMDVTPQEGITQIFYPWRNLAVSITISRDEERKNSGKYQILDLMKAKTQQAERTMRKRINAILHGLHGSYASTFCDTGNTADSAGGASVNLNVVGGTNSGTKVPYSLDAFVRYDAGNDASHTVARVTSDLDGNTNPWWCNMSMPGRLPLKVGGDVGDATSTTEDEWLEDIRGPIDGPGQNLISAMTVGYLRASDGSEHPDLGLTSEEIYQVYHGALVPMERYTDNKVGDAGFTNLQFMGMTIMTDKGIIRQLSTYGTSGAVAVPFYMLNTEYLEWVVDSETDFATTDFVRPENQQAKTAQILLMANLTCLNRGKQMVLACWG